MLPQLMPKDQQAATESPAALVLRIPLPWTPLSLLLRVPWAGCGCVHLQGCGEEVTPDCGPPAMAAVPVAPILKGGPSPRTRPPRTSSCPPARQPALTWPGPETSQLCPLALPTGQEAGVLGFNTSHLGSSPPKWG